MGLYYMSMIVSSTGLWNCLMWMCGRLSAPGPVSRPAGPANSCTQAPKCPGHTWNNRYRPMVSKSAAGRKGSSWPASRHEAVGSKHNYCEDHAGLLGHLAGRRPEGCGEKCSLHVMSPWLQPLSSPLSLHDLLGSHLRSAQAPPPSRPPSCHARKRHATAGSVL